RRRRLPGHPPDQRVAAGGLRGRQRQPAHRRSSPLPVRRSGEVKVRLCPAPRDGGGFWGLPSPYGSRGGPPTPAYRPPPPRVRALPAGRLVPPADPPPP